LAFARDASVHDNASYMTERYEHGNYIDTSKPLLEVTPEALAGLTTELAELIAAHRIGEAPEVEPADLRVIKVESKADFAVAYYLLNMIFSDPRDRMTLWEFYRLVARPDIGAIYLFKTGETCIGFQAVRFHPELAAAYVPYVGLSADYRGLGLYPKLARQTADALRQRGVTHVLEDYEDERAVQTGIYRNEQPNAVSERIAARRRFFRQTMSTLIVDDATIPYCRPASDDTQAIQAYDSLGVRFLSNRPADDLRTERIDGADVPVAISRQLYRRLYLELAQLDWSTSSNHLRTEAELRMAYPAIDDFLTRIDALPVSKHWIDLER
jgi:ribosomal protein S18 acetylase RimI-like enzyme